MVTEVKKMTAIRRMILKLVIQTISITFLVMILTSNAMANDNEVIGTEIHELKNAELVNYIFKKRRRRSGTGYPMKCIPGEAKVCRIFKNGSIIKELCLRRRVQKCTSLDQ